MIKVVNFAMVLFSFIGTAQAERKIDFGKDIKPIIDRRCIQCHSCYNTPCRLKLTTPEGIKRGLLNPMHGLLFDSIVKANPILGKGMEFVGNEPKKVVYDSKRFRAIEPTRLFVDQKTTQGWRNMGFRPIIKGSSTLLRSSYSYISTLLKDRVENPGAIKDKTPEDFKKHQAEFSRQCPDNMHELNKHLKQRAEVGSPAGMPYGLPPLTEKEIETVELWEEQGAQLPEDNVGFKITSKSDKGMIKKWQNFLNTTNYNSEKRKFKNELVSRYLYEHLFLAHIYFDKDNSSGQFYELVRSKNDCNNNVLDVVNTRRPWDMVTNSNSKPMAFKYCFRKITSTLVHKTHITYLMDEAKLNRVKDLFFHQMNWDYNGFEDSRLKFKNARYRTAGPREDRYASNPFFTFKAIPAKVRYQFLLDDAQYHVMTFIRGPVCKANTAVNSIDEQFHVLFVKPEKDFLSTVDAATYTSAVPLLKLPAEMGSDTELIDIGPLDGSWRAGRKRRLARDAYRKMFAGQFKHPYSVKDLWTGNSSTDFRTPNKSSLLTVFRNYDSASVVQGAVGSTSKTIFVLDYSILERLVYSLVTGFDVFGDASHQVSTRLYMSFLKMEAEELFLRFLPSKVRTPMRRSWYIPVEDVIVDKIFKRFFSKGKEKIDIFYPLYGTDIESGDDYIGFSVDPNASAADQLDSFLSLRIEFMNRAKNHLDESYTTGYVDRINSEGSRDYWSQQTELNEFQNFEKQLSRIAARPAKSAPWVLKMPSVASLLVTNSKGEKRIYTMVRQKEHFNVVWISSENNRRNPEADTVFFYRGVLGSYPNMIFDFKANEVEAFTQQLVSLKANDDLRDYKQLIATYGRSRTSDQFWKSYDKLIETFKEESPIQAGVLDLNRYGVDFEFVGDPLKAHEEQKDDLLKEWFNKQ